ncbi:hypothetical protein SDC9_188997 [bioreactor metagenome]|uniref:Uncharacterized protein n=1 Tax=bioreactor metagenome TaxID=1076179 RepID=A0A645HQW5_9ZZZZ
MRLQRKGGKGGESAADADLEKQQRTRIEHGTAPRSRHDKPEQKGAEHIDAKRDEGKAAFVPDGRETDEITQDRTDKTAETDKEAIENHRHATKLLRYSAARRTRNGNRIAPFADSGK